MRTFYYKNFIYFLLSIFFHYYFFSQIHYSTMLPTEQLYKNLKKGETSTKMQYEKADITHRYNPNIVELFAC